MKENSTKSKYYPGVGRRKAAIATTRLTPGKGVITINEKPVEQYFINSSYVDSIKAPLKILSKDTSYDVSIRVNGGGLRAQAEAARLGIARALLALNEDFRITLRKEGFLTRDGRVKERKKPGLKKARKAPQFSKR